MSALTDAPDGLTHQLEQARVDAARATRLAASRWHRIEMLDGHIRELRSQLHQEQQENGRLRKQLHGKD